MKTTDTPVTDATPHNVGNLAMLCRELERGLQRIAMQDYRGNAPTEVYIAKEVLSCASEQYYGHQTTKSELDDYGNKIKVTRRKDGTTTIKSSGPCGRSDYDENGNLC